MKRTAFAMVCGVGLLGLVLASCAADGSDGKAAGVSAAPQAAAAAAAAAPTTKPRRRGYATVEVHRPKRFPHRIWAACGYETRLPSYGWFGAAQAANVPKYPGNVHALRGRGPYKKWAGVMVGMNPVPGPCMGKVNYMYCRYYLKGATQARFQHYSLSSGDNCNILVKGLTEGKWSEVTMNFTRDSRRNDGSGGAFKPGERMDDLKVFVGKVADAKKIEMILDDVIFFAMDPAAKPEPEPFPKRVIYVAGFDTGIRPEKTLRRFFPGEFVIAAKPPAGSYFSVTQAVPDAATKSLHVLLSMTPPAGAAKTPQFRQAGAHTKCRFRYWVSGADAIDVTLRDATAKADHLCRVKGAKQGKWVTQYVNFTRATRSRGSKLAAGNRLESLRFAIPAGADARLYIDEVVVFDANEK